MTSPLITFALYDSGGAPKDDATPTFDKYVDGVGAPQSAPSIENLGGGLYGFEPSADDVADGRGYLIATGAEPAYFSGGIGNLVAFGMYDGSGAPAGANVTVEEYVDREGNARTPPTVYELADGLYGFEPTAEDREEGTAYLLATDATPAYLSGLLEQESSESGDAPVVSNPTPTPGTALQPGDAVGFDVTDESGAFRRVLIGAAFAGSKAWDVVSIGDVFAPLYSGSSRTNIAGGYRYSLRRQGGWPGPPSITAIAIDQAGNEDGS